MLNLFQNKRSQRPASQDVGKDLVSNRVLQVNQPMCNLAPVNKNQQMQHQQQDASGQSRNERGRLNGGTGVAAPPQQQAHSATRDLDAMGLMTQVKKGDDARKKNPRQGGHQVAATNQQSNMAASRQAPKLNLNMANQQLTNNAMYYLLKPQAEAVRGRKTLLLDVDETLVHSSFTPPEHADIVLPIDIEGRTCNIYVQVRPGCCDFIVEVGKYFEVVIFTASLSKYAIPLMDILDPERVAPQRLFREHCTYFNNQFVKDMARVGRRMEDIIIIDNSPNSYQFQPENGLPCISWYDDPNDRELFQFIPGLRLLAQVDDVRPVLLQSCFENEWNIDVSNKICESLLILKYQKQREEQENHERQLQYQLEQQEKQRAILLAEQEQLEVEDAVTNNNSQTMLEEKASELGDASSLREPGQMMQIDEKVAIKTQSGQNEPEPGDKTSASRKQEQSNSNRTDWVAVDSSQPGPKISKKEITFSGSGKKAQPKQARSSSKPKQMYEVGQGGAVGHASNYTQRVNRYQNGKDLVPTSNENKGSAQLSLSAVDGKETGQTRMRYQPGPKIQKEAVQMHTTAPSKQSRGQSRSTNTGSTNNAIAGAGSSTTAVPLSKKAANSLNTDKLKQYLISSQQEDINTQQKQMPKTSSRNQNEGTLTGSHRNLHTVGHLMLKQSSLNPRTATADNEHRKNANITFTTQSHPKTIALKQPQSDVVRSSVTNGSKRRANSNHLTDKKVNLDKFLSVVQQRSNYTPSNQVNGRMAPQGIAHLYKSNEEKKQFTTQGQNSNLTTNHSRNIERKKIGQMRLGHNATDMVFAQKKLSLKVDREQANKTQGGTGISLNQNDIVFSKTMNLSQLLTAQTKKIRDGAATQGQHQTTESLTTPNSGQISKVRASQELGQRQVQHLAHKRQKSGHTANSQNWTPTAASQIANFQGKQNPYMQSNANAIQQLMQGQAGVNKYTSTKLNGSHQQLRNQQNNTSLTSKRMSAGNINVPQSRSMHFSNSLNSRQPGAALSASQTKIKPGGVNKIKQSSSVNPTDRNAGENSNPHNVKMQTFLDDASQQFSGIGGTGVAASKVHSLTRSNRDYQRSPGKIFNGNLTGAQALIAASSSNAKTINSKAINYVKSTQQNQISNKRTSKPQLMSELTLSLKNKKNTPQNAKPQGESGFSNMIKPLVSAGRAPQTTKHTPAMENFSSRSYTQRVGAANAANGGLRPGAAHIQQLSKNQIVKQSKDLIKGGAVGTDIELNKSASKMTPRKKVVKLVSNALPPNSLAANQNAMIGSQTTKNKNKPGGLDPSQAALINNYYHSLQRHMNDGSAISGGPPNAADGNANGGSATVPQREIKQRQQIYSMLNDFERTSKFNKEQMKNFGSPKGAQAQTNLGNDAVAKIETQAAIGGKKPKIRNSNKD